MNRPNYRSANKWLAWLMALAIVSVPLAVFAQTKIVYHNNKFKLTDDVKLGGRRRLKLKSNFRSCATRKLMPMSKELASTWWRRSRRSFSTPSFAITSK